MPNALARDVGFKLGPILVEVLAKHYLERGKVEGEHEPVQLRKDGILFDEAFSIVKVSAYHSREPNSDVVELFQSFLNTASW